MVNVTGPQTAGKPFFGAYNVGAHGAAVTLTLPTYFPDFDLRLANCILSIGHVNLTDATVLAYAPGDQVVLHAGVIGGKFRIITARTFEIGNATKANSCLKLSYRAMGNIQNT